MTRTVTGGPRPVPLTEREGELLAWLIGRGGALATRGEIFDALWAPHGGATENVVDVYVGYLRRKLAKFAGVRARAAHAARAGLPARREGRGMIREASCSSCRSSCRCRPAPGRSATS